MNRANALLLWVQILRGPSDRGSKSFSGLIPPTKTKSVRHPASHYLPPVPIMIVLTCLSFRLDILPPPGEAKSHQPLESQINDQPYDADE